MDQKLRILRRQAFAENATPSDLQRYILALEQKLNISREPAPVYPAKTYGALIDELLKLSETALMSDVTVEDGTISECYAAELRIAGEEHDSLDEGHPVIHFNETDVIENDEDDEDEEDDDDATESRQNPFHYDYGTPPFKQHPAKAGEVPVHAPPEVKMVGQLMIESAANNGEPPNAVYINRYEFGGDEEWVASDNFERGYPSLVYRDGLWYWRQWGGGEDSLIEGGQEEAEMFASVYFDRV